MPRAQSALHLDREQARPRKAQSQQVDALNAPTDLMPDDVVTKFGEDWFGDGLGNVSQDRQQPGLAATGGDPAETSLPCRFEVEVDILLEAQTTADEFGIQRQR